MADVSRFLNIADLRAAAEKRLPRVAFDYIDGGADGEVTLRENVRAFDDVKLRPRSAVAIPASELGLSVSVMGQTFRSEEHTSELQSH